MAAEASTHQRDALATLALECLEDGRDPITDKAMQRALVAEALSARNLPNHARERADQRIAEAIATRADEILSSWATALRPHAEVLAEAAAAGDMPADLHETGAAHTPDAMQRLAEATIATRLFSQAYSGVAQVGSIGAFPSRWDRTLVLAAPGYDAMQDAKRSTNTVDAWALARAGLPVQLVASIAEYDGRQAEYTRQANESEAERTERTKSAAGQSLMRVR